MSYKIKNGFIYILLNNKWWIEEVFHAMYPNYNMTKMKKVE